MLGSLSQIQESQVEPTFRTQGQGVVYNHCTVLPRPTGMQGWPAVYPGMAVYLGTRRSPEGQESTRVCV